MKFFFFSRIKYKKKHRDPLPLIFCDSRKLIDTSFMIKDQFVLTNKYIFDGDLTPLSSFIQRFTGRVISFKEIIKEFELTYLMGTFSSNPDEVFNERDPETSEPPISISRFIYTGVLGPQLKPNV